MAVIGVLLINTQTFLTPTVAFYIIGGVAGFSLSGVQAVSRTMVSQLTPFDKTAEFYGFLSVAGRTSTFIGPVVFGSIYHGVSKSMLNNGASDALAQSTGIYWAIGSILVFLVVGLLLLQIVRRVTHKDPLKFEE
ncbi:hypothetical protein SDC9_147492 [bioreactor metagenome]|uniref:Major facilitator superfamily (MFS) profile domain-containing protein n=1 Tax=bioreactor metagenome TaxID=1076179 RepID=A0A645EE64_9ZZZZ